MTYTPPHVRIQNMLLGYLLDGNTVLAPHKAEILDILNDIKDNEESLDEHQRQHNRLEEQNKELKKENRILSWFSAGGIFVAGTCAICNGDKLAERIKDGIHESDNGEALDNTYICSRCRKKYNGLKMPQYGNRLLKNLGVSMGGSGFFIVEGLLIEAPAGQTYFVEWSVIDDIRKKIKDQKGTTRSQADRTAIDTTGAIRI